MIAALQLVTRNPVPVGTVQRHQPALLAEFDCNENCATMLGGGRVYGRCLHLTLRWFECGNPNLSEKPRSPPHGIYGLRARDMSTTSLPPSAHTPTRPATAARCAWRIPSP